jgi:hypothetical protein
LTYISPFAGITRTGSSGLPDSAGTLSPAAPELPRYLLLTVSILAQITELYKKPSVNVPVGSPSAKTTVNGIRTLSMPCLEILSTAVAKNGVIANTASEIPGSSSDKTT